MAQRAPLRSIRGVWRNRRGAAAAEFALIGSVLLTLVLGIYDVGMSVYQQMVIQEALRSGAHFAMSFPTHTTKIKDLVTSALPTSWQDDPSVTVSVSAPACDCESGGVATAALCSANCGAGSTRRGFITINVSHSFSPLLLTTLSSNASSHVVRFQ
jgi:Flp pilus assembly protein TadG